MNKEKLNFLFPVRISSSLKMNQILDENGQMLGENKNDAGRYRVEFTLQNESRTIDLLLTVKKTKKKDTREIIATLLKRKSTQIRKVKHIFIKRIQGFTSGLEGTKAYLQLLTFQKQERKRIGQQKRLFTRYHIKKYPFKPQSKTIQWTRHLFLGFDELKQNIVKNHHNQTQRYWFDIQFGYILRNVETDEKMQFYPSGNTSLFNANERPLVN